MKQTLMRLVRVSPAMVVAMLALFVALTGTAVATTSALITGNQIKNSSITGADVKNKSLRPIDFRVRGARVRGRAARVFAVDLAQPGTRARLAGRGYRKTRATRATLGSSGRPSVGSRPSASSCKRRVHWTAAVPPWPIQGRRHQLRAGAPQRLQTRIVRKRAALLRPTFPRHADRRDTGEAHHDPWRGRADFWSSELGSRPSGCRRMTVSDNVVPDRLRSALQQHLRDPSDPHAQPK